MKHDYLAPLRPRILAEKANGKPAWRSLEDRAHRLDADEPELPSGTAPLSAIDRRNVLKLAGATFALAGATACFRRPEEEIMPYTHQPEEIVPGLPTYYASAQPRSDGAVGVLVETHEGRPTKIEGNALHPSSLGAADVWAQAEILKLYDPDRARSPISAGKGVSYADWDTFAKTHFEKFSGNGGSGLALLLEEDESPTCERLIAALLAKLPNAKVFRWDPLASSSAKEGAAIAYGPNARVHHDLSKAKTVFALDSHFFFEGPDHIRMAKQWAQARRSKDVAEAKNMSRLYVAEGVYTSTGASADHRLRIASRDGKALLLALVGELAKAGVTVAGVTGGAAPAGSEKFLAGLAKDLAAGGVVLVGERQPAAVHALAHAINAAVKSAESGVTTVTVPAVAHAKVSEGIEALKKALDDKAIDTLVVIDGNPAYTAPGALAMSESLKKASTLVHVGVSYDETAQIATWHVPMAHFLESWDDSVAWDGTVSIVQPMIMPIFDARPRVSVLAQLAGLADTADRGLVEETHKALLANTPGSKPYKRALHDGVVSGSTRVAGGAFDGAKVAAAVGALADGAALSKDSIEVAFLFNNVLDGRLANNPWVQELPDGMSKLCWDNALLVSPQLARELGLESGVHKNRYRADVVTLTVGAASVDVPTFVLPGLAPYTAQINRGYGRKVGEVASGVGVDVAAIVPVPSAPSGSRVAVGVKITRTGKTIDDLCSTQDHFFVPASPMHEPSFAARSGAAAGHEDRKLGLGERHLYRKASLKMYEEKPAFAHEGDVPEELVGSHVPGMPLKLKQPTNEYTYDSQQWGMVIDLGTCIGCNACTIACQSENNIPAVGKPMVLLGREMHWIRIDRYFVGDVDDAEAVHMPIPCMHCENAPCEPVCPVSATVHDEEGINGMAYNRCIGTRYCANNCPYKVRRFNYLDFTVTGNVYRNAHRADRHDIYKLQRNPNVTVRYRGVMEKCTYCTQRIEEAKIAAKRRGEDRKGLPDGAVTPACAQTCPTDAITFGNINDPKSRVAALKKSDRNYEMLQELNIRPRTTFLARVKNTNSEVG